MMDKLMNLIKFLKSKNHPIINSIRAGWTREKIKSFVEESEIIMPNILIDHFQACIGVDGQKKLIGELSLFPGGIPINIEDSIDLYTGEKPLKEWRSSLFPIFENNLGGFHLFETSQDQNFGRIFYYSPSSTDFEVIISYYDSYSSMIETIYRCYIEGACFVFDGRLDYNRKEVIEISKRLNPNSEYWKIFDLN